MARFRTVLLALLMLSVPACKRADPVVSVRPEPVSSASATPLTGPVTLVISKTTIAIDSDPAPIVTLTGDLSKGVPAELKKNGANDLFVVPLAKAFERERARGRLKDTIGIVVDKDTPYRLLFEVLFTAGQSEIGEYDLHQDTESGPGLVTRPPKIEPRPSLSAPLPPGEKLLNLVTLIVADGISLKTAGGNVAPGCKDQGAGLAIPLRDNGYDLPALTACVTKLKHLDPAFENESSVVMTGNASTPFHDIVSVAAALRGAHGELFPDVHFGVTR